ncbi:MAG: amidohydrolase/deacetylase family metallohydrolase [Terracidiphilus sp.]|jgi:dihydroorotase
MKRILFAIVVLAMACAPLQAQRIYDLLLRDGHVIDPANQIDSVMDVAVDHHHIVAVAAHIDPSLAVKTIDVSGLYVTPGLIDIHVHVYAGTGEAGSYAGDNSVYPDGFTFRAGVTTVADAGCSGWKNFEEFKAHIIDRSKTRVLAFLNIVGAGMRGPKFEQNLDEMDPIAAAAMAHKYPGVIVGIKTAHYFAPDWTAVEWAVEAGTLADIPVMVDFGSFLPERPYQELVTSKIRPGDISTHMYRDMVPILDAQGKVLPYLFEARKRGVIFDVGHGGGSFQFSQAVPAVQQGWVPDSISTDLHIGSMNSGMKDMLNLMSKFLNMGISLQDVIRDSTSNPAKEIKHPELGTLSVGSDADIAVLRLEHGHFGFVDSSGARLNGDRKLICEITVRDGQVVWDLNGLAGEDWTKQKRERTQGRH